MTLALVPHAADDPRTLRIWVGIAHCEPDTASTWLIDGKPVQAVTLRALRAWRIPGCRPFHSGVFELHGLQPATRYEITLRQGKETIVRTMQTLPAVVPASDDGSFNLLLLSCFHGAQDATGIAGRELATLKPRPDFTILAGDQVYLDLPTLSDFRDEPAWLQRKFQQDYLTNWFGTPQQAPMPHDIPAGFPQILSLAPIVTLPDDHEYWNNAPFSSPIIQNSWTEAGRRNWSEAAELAFDMFQNGSAQKMGTPRRIEIDPLSFLVLDTRSTRNRGQGDQPDSKSMRLAAGDLLGPQGRDALRDWADMLIAAAGDALPRYGVLVTGQSLFAEAAGELRGNLADFEFPDYPEDYRFIIEQIERISHAGLPVLCLTGDVHWGRILRAAGPLDSAPVFEVISSPTSLVESVGADQVALAVDGIRSLFGQSRPWPRHHDARTPPPRFGTAASYTPDILNNTAGEQAAMRGNMALMLRFCRIGPAVDVEIDYLPLHKDRAVNTKGKWQVAFRLRPSH